MCICTYLYVYVYKHISIPCGFHILTPRCPADGGNPHPNSVCGVFCHGPFCESPPMHSPLWASPSDPSAGRPRLRPTSINGQPQGPIEQMSSSLINQTNIKEYHSSAVLSPGCKHTDCDTFTTPFVAQGVRGHRMYECEACLHWCCSCVGSSCSVHL